MNPRIKWLAGLVLFICATVAFAQSVGDKILQQVYDPTTNSLRVIVIGASPPTPTPTAAPSATPTLTPTPAAATPTFTPTGLPFVSPVLPQSTVDTTLTSPPGATINATSPTLNANINTLANGTLGGTIVLPAGSNCSGHFLLPINQGAPNWINIQTGNYSSLPPENNRVTKAQAVNMPTITGDAAANPIFDFQPKASYYRVMGFPFA